MLGQFLMSVDGGGGGGGAGEALVLITRSRAPGLVLYCSVPTLSLSYTFIVRQHGGGGLIRFQHDNKEGGGLWLDSGQWTVDTQISGN